MMKIICKTILISIISSMLMMNDFIAFAQQSQSRPRDVQQGEMIRQNDGSYSQTNTTHVSGVKDDDFLNTITMVAIAFIATRLYKYSKLTTDMMIAAAGGAAFIVGETMTNNGYKDIAHGQTKSLTMNSDASKNDNSTNAQIEDIKKLKKSYEDAKSVAEKKHSLQQAAYTAFAAAGVAAIWDKVELGTAFTEFNAVIEASKIACPDSAASATAELAIVKEFLPKLEVKIPSTILMDEKNKFDLASDKNMSTFYSTATTYQTRMSATLYGGPAAEACATAVLNVTRAVAKLKETEIKVTVAGTPENFSQGTLVTNTQFKNNIFYNLIFKKRENRILEKNYFQSFLNILIPVAMASDTSLLFGAAGALVGMLLVNEYSVMIDTYLFAPGNRALIWGILAGVTFIAADTTDKLSQEMGNNIAKLDKLINSLSNLQSSPGVAPSSNEQVVDLTGALVAKLHQPDVNITPKGTKASCVVSNGESHCTALTPMITSSPSFASFSPSFQSIATQVGRMGDGLSGTGTLSGATMSNVSALAGQARAIGKALKDEQAKLNSLLGDNKIDFANEEKQMLKDFNQIGASVLKKNGQTPSGFLASIGASAISGTDSAIGKVADESTAKKPVPVAAIGFGSASKANKGHEFKFLNDQGPEGAAAATPDNSANAKYDMGATEINQNSKVSIFELISTRYFKSAFPKLLEEDNLKK